MSEVHEQLGSDLRGLLVERLGAASLVETFNNHGGKVLNRMEEPDGRQFVARTFEGGGENQFSEGFYSPDLDLEAGLAAMNSMYANAGLRVVKSSVLPAEKGKPVTIIAEYIPWLASFQTASVEAKQEAVKGLAKLLDPSFPYLPAGEALVSELFMYMTDEDGTQHPIVVDNEPRLMSKNPLRSRSGVMVDSIRGQYIDAVGSLIEHFWASNYDEMAALARAFFSGLSSIDNDSIHEGQTTTEAIMSMHAFTQPELMGIRKILGR